MQNGIDLSQFYQGLDALFQKKDSSETMRYLERCRLELAKKLLSDTQKSIFDISADVGFSTLQHFSYVFKKNVGLSPTRYRRKAPPWSTVITSS